MPQTIGNNPKLRVAYTDTARNYVERILKHVEDQYDIELTTERDADFVFHSSGGLDVLKYPGVRIFFTGENITPNFAISDYAMAFEKMAFSDRNLWLPLCRRNARYPGLLKPRPDPSSALASKKDFCSYVMSNTNSSDDARSRIFDLLSEYKTVNSGGLWRNNVGGRVQDKQAFQSTHKFAIAFENCSYPGYLTEKFTDAAVANCIPIYWGDPDVGKLFNPKSFINCHDYDSLEAVVERVHEVDNDDKLYLEMLAEPWFPDGKEPECFSRETIARFLTNIFDQSREQAYRRNRGRWGLKNEKNLYDMHFRPHVQYFKRLRAIWRIIYHKVMPHRKRF